MIRILVVENENIIAMEISWIVEDAGYSIVGPERSVETTRQVLSRHKVDLALLDVHLAGETVFPVSEMLDAILTSSSQAIRYPRFLGGTRAGRY